MTPGGTQGLDRYQYTSNNPINRVDPSGHFDDCGAATGGKQCAADNAWTENIYKQQIKNDYGVTMSDEGEAEGTNNFGDKKAWNLDQLRQVYGALNNIDDKIGGQLQSLIRGSTFSMNEYDNGYYHGKTYANRIDFATGGNFPNPYINIYHEVGHLINLNSEGGNKYVDAFQEKTRSWITSDGRLDTNALNSSTVSDPWWNSQHVGYGPQTACQGTCHTDQTSSEQWADTFANYIAGNINTSPDNQMGIDMNAFVSGLFP